MNGALGVKHKLFLCLTVHLEVLGFIEKLKVCSLDRVTTEMYLCAAINVYELTVLHKISKSNFGYFRYISLIILITIIIISSNYDNKLPRISSFLLLKSGDKNTYL